MVAVIFDKVQVEKDKDLETLPRILIAEGLQCMYSTIFEERDF